VLDGDVQRAAPVGDVEGGAEHFDAPRARVHAEGAADVAGDGEIRFASSQFDVTRSAAEAGLEHGAGSELEAAAGGAARAVRQFGKQGVETVVVVLPCEMHGLLS